MSNMKKLLLAAALVLVPTSAFAASQLCAGCPCGEQCDCKQCDCKR